MAVSPLVVSHRKQRHDIYWHRNQHVPVQKIANVALRKCTDGADKMQLRSFLFKYMCICEFTLTKSIAVDDRSQQYTNNPGLLK